MREQLLKLREEIDSVDAGLVELFTNRMKISRSIAQVKASGNIPISDGTREQQVLAAAMSKADDIDKADVVAFMRNLIALSKLAQNRILSMPEAISFPNSAAAKSGTIKAGFQGVSGAWSEHSAGQLFPSGELVAFDQFEDVFEAVKAGVADYGVLPIENSHTGAIGEVYDLLRRHGCYIVGEIWISVAQCLLAVEGAALQDIREVFSHPEGFNQCRRFLKNRSWDLTACRNTAYAAQMVARDKNKKYAAIGSRRAAQVHGLSVLAEDIMDDKSNKTRFIAIAAEPEYDESSTTTSITFSTMHKSGALCAVLQSFMLAGINLSRIESRPVSADKYRFFADLQANILNQDTLDALKQAAAQCDYFEVLGCYAATAER